MVATPKPEAPETGAPLVLAPVIEVFTKDYCPYCDKAKLLLKQLGLPFTETDITADPEGYDKIRQRNPAARTVPQIFINNQPIGGCDDLYALHAAGRLLPLVKGA